MANKEIAQSVEVTIADAWLLDAGEGRVTLRLDGVTVAEPDWEKIEGEMDAAGIDKMDATFLVEQFAEMSYAHLLAKALAKRVTRVG